MTLVHDDTIPNITVLAQIEVAHGLYRCESDCLADLNPTFGNRASQRRTHVLLRSAFALYEQIPCMGQPECPSTCICRNSNSDLCLTAPRRGLKNTVVGSYQGFLGFHLVVIERNGATEVHLGRCGKIDLHVAIVHRQHIIQTTIGKNQCVTVPLEQVQLLRGVADPKVHTDFLSVLRIRKDKLLLAPCKQLLRRVLNSELIANSYLHWDTHSPRVIPNCLISDAERTVFIKNRFRITVKDRK